MIVMNCLKILLLVPIVISTRLLAVPMIQSMDNIIQPENKIIQPVHNLIYPIDGDVDGDGVDNKDDAFPSDPKEWLDSDKDGIGNNADKDDDNDGMSDSDEIHYGFNPLDPSDATLDTDNDGVNNLKEIQDGTNPLGNITISTIFKEVAYDRWEEIPFINKNGLRVYKDKNQSIRITKINTRSTTKIFSEVEGAQVKWFIDGKLDIIFPFTDTVKFRLESNGKVVPYISNVVLKDIDLPAGTIIHTDDVKTEIIIPLSKSEFIKF